MSSTAASIFPISLGPPQDSSTSSYLHLSGHAGPSSKPYKNPGADDEDEYDDDEDDDGLLEDDYDDDEGGDGGAMMLDDEQGSGRPGRITTAGEPIASSATFMRGHGSYLAAPPRRKEDRYVDDDDQQDGQSGAKATATNTNGISTTSELIYSSLAGLVLRTNKLISVRSLRSRYTPEVGDLVVGRIVEVQPGAKRWKVDIASRQDASLALSSINLPGGVQRKKLESDELQMRTFFKEGDLLVAEVQSVFHDGSVALHTRSLRYGKLRNGELAQVQSNLIQRLKSHFLHLDKAGVDLTIGMNGWVWCSKHIAFDVDAVEAEGKGSAYEGKGIGGAGVGMDIDAGAGVYGDANEVSRGSRWIVKNRNALDAFGSLNFASSHCANRTSPQRRGEPSRTCARS